MSQTDPCYILHEVNAVEVTQTPVDGSEVTARSKLGLPSHVFHAAAPLCQPFRWLQVNHAHKLPTVTKSTMASYISWQQTETLIRHSRRPRGQLLCHALWLPCIRCGRPKGTEPAANAFTDTRDSRPLQDSIKDLSSLHPVTVLNCLPCCTLVMTLFMLRRVRNCRHYYYYYY